MGEKERVDMWVQKLGGCPSYEDFLDFGADLDNPKFGGERYVTVKELKYIGCDTKRLHFGEYSKGSNKMNGRVIVMD